MRGLNKIWLEPKIALATNYHYNKRQLKEIKTLVEIHKNELISAWKQHFNR
ncbi:MAG: DUF4160 domain-containing protein [Proteobacteria bacterium]|nr:DUF4160 domain-containing protein [Pseudomonadota bacterium]